MIKTTELSPKAQKDVKEPSNRKGQINISTLILSISFLIGLMSVANGLILLYQANEPSSYNALETSAPTPAPVPIITLSPTPMIMRTAIPIPTVTETPTPVPIPTSTPEPIIVATPTGNSVYVRVMSGSFTIPNIQINVGDKLVWDNFDDVGYTIIEMDQKIENITLGMGKRTAYTFNKTGDYKLGLYSSYKQTLISFQDISVRVNVTQNQKTLAVGET